MEKVWTSDKAQPPCIVTALASNFSEADIAWLVDFEIYTWSKELCTGVGKCDKIFKKIYGTISLVEIGPFCVGLNHQVTSNG